MTDFIFETEDRGLLAPPSHGNFNLIDGQLAGEIQKIPDQLAFKIGDVATLTDLKAYVLRYWETEFEQLRPKKSRHNQRVYSRKDVELIMLIKKLLYRDRYSIEGARAAIRKHRKELKHVDEVLEASQEAIVEPITAPSPAAVVAAEPLIDVVELTGKLEGLLARVERFRSLLA